MLPNIVTFTRWSRASPALRRSCLPRGGSRRRRGAGWLIWLGAAWRPVYLLHVLATAAVWNALLLVNIVQPVVHVVLGTLIGTALPLLGYVLSQRLNVTRLMGFAQAGAAIPEDRPQAASLVEPDVSGGLCRRASGFRLRHEFHGAVDSQCRLRPGHGEKRAVSVASMTPATITIPLRMPASRISAGTGSADQ